MQTLGQVHWINKRLEMKMNPFLISLPWFHDHALTHGPLFVIMICVQVWFHCNLQFLWCCLEKSMHHLVVCKLSSRVSYSFVLLSWGHQLSLDTFECVYVLSLSLACFLHKHKLYTHSSLVTKTSSLKCSCITKQWLPHPWLTSPLPCDSQDSLLVLFSTSWLLNAAD